MPTHFLKIMAKLILGLISIMEPMEFKLGDDFVTDTVINEEILEGHILVK